MGKRKHYEVQHLSKMKIQDGKRFFRVKWVGYPSSQNTWQPQQHLNPALIESFLEQQQIRQIRRKQQNRKKILNPEVKNDRYTIKILERKQLRNDQGQYQFIILNGIRKQTVPRSYLYNKYPEKLARFYLKQLKNQNQPKQKK